MIKGITNVSEKMFSEYLKRLKLQYIYQPKIQALKGIGYTPDFYVLQNDTFYEVVGSKQAFNINKPKLLAAQALINLKIVRPDGMLYNFSTKKFGYLPKNFEVRVLRTGCVAFDFISLMNDKKLQLTEIAKAMGSSQPTATNCARRGYLKRIYFANLESRYGDLSKYVQSDETAWTLMQKEKKVIKYACNVPYFRKNKAILLDNFNQEQK
jgi:hypothetical protein